MAGRVNPARGPSADRPGTGMGLPQWPFRSLATNLRKPASQLPAETQDTTTLPFLYLTGNWIARLHRPLTSFATNSHRPPAAQLPGVGHDKELTSLDFVLALKSVMSRPHLPLCSLITK